MKRLITILMSALLISLGIPSLSSAVGSKLIEGDILKIDGEFYTVHDKSGHEVRLHVDKTTRLEGGAFKAGDKVEVHATDKGHARSIVHLTAAGKLTTAGSKIIEGDILKIDGEFYTVHDMAGHEVRLHVDKTTHVEGGAFKAGDKVEAYATDKGHVRYLYHLTQMQPVP